MRWLVTGGAGFIGSHFVRTALTEEWTDEVVVLDLLTYAGNLENLRPVERHAGFSFVRGDICDPDVVAKSLVDVDAVFHFAAESHVDRSIESAASFVRTNVVGTQIMLDAARTAKVKRFIHVSTDEVYGSLALDAAERFVETRPVQPTSPYAASKTASDHMVLAAERTHGLDAVVTRCSNNYGPYQFPEKFIPLFVSNAMEGKPLPLYGDGRHVRDWIHVDDHIRGLRLAWERGGSGEVYNLGGECERHNRDIALAIVRAVGADESLIQPVTDRLAHDRRYAIDPQKARAELGFEPGPPIEERMAEIVDWYRENRMWWQRIKAGEYRGYYERMYSGR
ncbi:MAG: dTDP-glucose 4,6-dehydratase [Deltaproteobacteria bacterium RIFOXYA12_FULL_58_15]|nr:MAG: dTDP-glucose 4,6-dehydratase [Deltaproteobacteria bacterium RIFOXYA12_FULL_58_15]OGR09834.1 MAG: dTDP-glucose 4,6-dehydratase [Deltaproteobacteria bacterium RIFOXYB12_FULL_58_9]